MRHDVGGLGPANAERLRQRADALSPRELLERPRGAAIDARRLRETGRRQIADLAGAAVRTGPEPAAEHEAEADASVQPHQGIVRVVPGGTAQPLGDGGQIHVVAVADGHPEVPRQRVAKPRLLPAVQMAGMPQRACLRIDDAGGGDHHLVDLLATQVSGGEHAVDRVAYLVTRVGAAALRNVHGVRRGDVAGQCGQGRPAAVLLDMDPDDVSRRRIDAVGAGLRTGSVGDESGLFDQLPGGQAVEERRHGRLGQAGQLADLAARHRTPIEQQAENDLIVDLSQQSGRAGSAAHHCPGRFHRAIMP